MTQQHFWVEALLPNGKRVFSSSSKSTTSEGRMLAAIVAKKLADKSITMATATGSFTDQPDITRLPIYLVVREWDGLNAAERAGANPDPWATEGEDLV